MLSVVESIPSLWVELIRADLKRHVGEGKRSAVEVMGRFGVKEKNLEGQILEVLVVALGLRTFVLAS